MQTKSFLSVLATVAALGFAGASQPAFAQSDDAVSVKVQFADLNLSSTAGAKVMLQRIRYAAKSVCGPEPSNPIHRVSSHYDACVKEATDRTIGRLNSPMVTALYSGRDSAPTTLASVR